jgi:nicotinamide mononucleotide (NMN) deamidase PncC
LGEEEEGSEGSVSPLVVTAMVTGVGRNGRATAEAIQIARGSTGVKERSEWGLDWVGLTDPDPSRLA